MEKVRIRLEGISKSYYSDTAVTQALRKITLEFRMGEFVAITGESGSGKSTLLNIIGGMDGFDDGEMYVDGEPTFQYDEADWEEYRRTKIGYVFQDYSLISHYSVLDNMTSALFVMGKNKAEAIEIARKYLAQVGLKEYEHHRASELSSGQKQRLSIARALAKNTGIIVADEPTGNLDSETGEQIISLLKELSKERLVIMVTHNYEQAEKYVTRKIRIHDGELILDMPVTNQIETSNDEKTEDYVKYEEQANISISKKEAKTALHFALKNAITQPGRAILFTGFLLVIAIASFLLFGELLLHSDDIYTKVYSNKAFYQENDTRLVVKSTDGSVLSQEDFDEIRKVTDVVAVDGCDFANDINYYIEEEVDYTYLFTWVRPGSDDDFKVLKLLSHTKFMRSAQCITEADLAYGRLPENRNEVVIYADNERAIGKVYPCYFAANNLWDDGEYYQENIKVVGVLKEETEQIYFSEELCNMLSMHMDSGVYRLYYEYDQYLMDYRQKPEWIPVVSDDLSGNQIRLSKKFENPVQGEVLFHFTEDESQEEYQEEMVEVVRGTHSATGDFVEVSQEFYDKYYTKEYTQASVYIASYAKTDEVISRLEKLGYTAVSTFRVSATEYMPALVYERLKILGICAGGLLALLIAEVLILRSLMKIRIKDYFVLKNIGMKLQVISKISYYELTGYCLLSCVITIILMSILRGSDIPMLGEMMWYYDFGAYLMFVLYNMVLTLLTVMTFNHLVKGRLNA